MYDSQNQLIRESDSRLGRTRTWTYDNAGNILSRTTYPYTTGELGTATGVATYSYDDPDWGDLLTGFSGINLAYDEIGNMTSFADRTFTWQHGRQLESQAFSDGEVWTYTYNADGMRTGRTNGSISYEYVYNGSQLMQMIRNGVVMNFTYINGIPATVSFGGNTFYYVVNGQGDITGITDAQGNIQVTYYYDAWGASSSIYNSNSDYGLTLATINPLRYRGYVYDWEVGLYYLQSRYYIPDLGRFLSSDSYTSTNQGLLGYNMFTYCLNNPVNRFDAEGNLSLPNWAKKVVAAVAVVAVVATVAAVTVATAGTGTAVAAVAVGAAKGAAMGMVSGAAIGAATGAASHRVSTGSWEGAGTAALNGMGSGALSGAISGAVTGGVQGYSSYSKASNFLESNGADPQDVLSCYKSTPKVKTLQTDTTVYRTWGGESGKFSHWVSPNNYGSSARSMLALPPGNTMANTSTFVIPRGTTVLAGKAARLFNQPGGGVQWWVSVLR